MKIICIGRNYAEHAVEMKAELPTEPVFFMKPDTAINKNSFMHIPEFTQNLHYELELVVRINKVGKYIDEEFAHKYYDEIGLGIDFTARDKQKECKEKRLPWEISKAFDNSAFLGETFIPKKELNLNEIRFSLQKNDLEVQAGDSGNMIFNIDQIIAYVSQFVTLKVGDLIYTGTPEGVGKVDVSDKLDGYIGTKQIFSLNIK